MREQACRCLSQGPAYSRLEAHMTMGRLGSSYGMRAILTDSAADASKAQGLVTRAISSLPAGTRDRCELTFELAKLYGTKVAALRDLNGALDTYSEAVTDMT